jgi:hypothetical protein
MDGKDDHHHRNRTKPRILYIKINICKLDVHMQYTPKKNEKTLKLILEEDLNLINALFM